MYCAYTGSVQGGLSLVIVVLGEASEVEEVGSWLVGKFWRIVPSASVFWGLGMALDLTVTPGSSGGVLSGLKVETGPPSTGSIGKLRVGLEKASNLTASPTSKDGAPSGPKSEVELLSSDSVGELGSWAHTRTQMAVLVPISTTQDFGGMNDEG